MGITATGMLGSGVGPGGGAVSVGAAGGATVGGGACVGGGGAFWVKSATTVWAAWVWIRVESWVEAGVAAPPQALRTNVITSAEMNITVL